MVASDSFQGWGPNRASAPECQRRRSSVEVHSRPWPNCSSFAQATSPASDIATNACDPRRTKSEAPVSTSINRSVVGSVIVETRLPYSEEALAEE